MTHKANFAKMWLRLTPNGQFWSFCRFFYLFLQNQARLTQNGQFHPIHNFPIFCHQSISFLEKSQKFLFLAGYISKFLSFSNFLNSFTSKWLTMTHNGQFCQKSSLDWLQMANFSHFAGFSIFSPK